MGLIPGLERSPGGGHGNPLQYSCLENPVDRGAWQATVHRVTESFMTEITLHTHKNVFIQRHVCTQLKSQCISKGFKEQHSFPALFVSALHSPALRTQWLFLLYLLHTDSQHAYVTVQYLPIQTPSLDSLQLKNQLLICSSLLSAFLFPILPNSQLRGKLMSHLFTARLHS